MKTIKIIYHIFFIALLFVSCTHPKPLQKEVVGSWKGVNKEVLVLNNDGTFKAKYLPSDFFYVWDKLDEVSFNGNGTWKILKRKSIEPYWLIDLNFKKTSINKSNFGMPLLISRSGLGGSDSKITSLFIWKGDPDEDNRYEFYKE